MSDYPELTALKVPYADPDMELARKRCVDSFIKILDKHFIKREIHEQCNKIHKVT